MHDDHGLDAAAETYIHGLRKKRRDVDMYRRNALHDAERWQRTDPAFARERQADAERARLHVERIKAKVEQAMGDPSSVFLPVGTVVRIVSHPAGDSTTTDMGPGHLPVVGTEGVVAKPNGGEGSIVVALVGSFRDGRGQEWHPTGDAAWGLAFERENLEVVGPGRFLDGRECVSYGFEPTHHQKGFPNQVEMLVEAKGLVWRIVPVAETIASPPEAYEDRAELDFLVDLRSGLTPQEQADPGVAPGR